jgi:hypothetical protein
MKKVLAILAVAAIFVACAPKAAPATEGEAADTTKTCCVKDTTATCCHADTTATVCSEAATTEVAE